MSVPKINGNLNISGTNAKLKDAIDGTGIQLEGSVNRLRILRDSDSWMPQSLINLGAEKVFSAVMPTGGQGEFGIAEKGGQCFPFADGHFYQNEGAYRCLDTSDLGNYHFYKYGQFYIDENTPTVTHPFSINSKGRPIFISVTGDINPVSAGSWIVIRIWKGPSVIASQIVQSTGASVNVPFCINYLDVTGAGQQNYAIDFSRGSGSTLFGEEGNQQAPQILAFEI